MNDRLRGARGWVAVGIWFLVLAVLWVAGVRLSFEGTLILALIVTGILWMARSWAR